MSGDRGAGPSLVERLHWRRIPRALRYVRNNGLTAAWRRLFPGVLDYQTWINRYDTLKRVDIVAIERHIQRLDRRPTFSLILPLGDGRERLSERAIASATQQLYPDWELCIGVDREEPARGLATRDPRIRIAESAAGGFAATANAALALATGDFIVLLHPEDVLAAHALYRVAVELEGWPDAVIVYSDEDLIDDYGRRDAPCFKSDWNPDLFYGCDAVGRLAAYRRSAVERAGGWRPCGAEEYDLALRVSEHAAPGAIRHIPAILYHRRAVAGGGAATGEAVAAVLAEHFARRGADVTVTPLGPGRARVRRPLPEPVPGVSLIVPTRDRVDMLRRCIDGLLEQTDYPRLEIVIVDNDSELPETRDYLAGLAANPAIRLLRFPGRFNYSAIHNFAVAETRHDIIGLVNNDVEIIHADWLREMVSHAVRPEVGAVGAKLYYPDDRIQHAGTIVGLGGAAGHAFRFFTRTDPGYCGRLTLTQDLSAVTAACMLLRKEVYEEVGGFDGINLAVAFNDVDFCLRIRERGYLIVWTPFAELYHRESASRGSDFAPENRARFEREIAYLATRWRDVIAHDPFYNPNLTVEREDFSLAFPPRVDPPWRPAPR